MQTVCRWHGTCLQSNPYIRTFGLWTIRMCLPGFRTFTNKCKQTRANVNKYERTSTNRCFWTQTEMHTKEQKWYCLFVFSVPPIRSSRCLLVCRNAHFTSLHKHEQLQTLWCTNKMSGCVCLCSKHSFLIVCVCLRLVYHPHLTNSSLFGMFVQSCHQAINPGFSVAKAKKWWFLAYWERLEIPIDFKVNC